MPSTPQAVPTVVLFDYLKDDSNNALIGAKVTVVLDAPAPITSVTPQVVLATVQQSTTTDGNGYWQFSLVPNTNINPANTTYTVQTPAGTYNVTLGSVGPYQSTAFGTIVNVPVPLSPAVTPTLSSLTIGGPLTVTGLLTAASAAITGAFSVAKVVWAPPPNGTDDTATLRGLIGTGNVHVILQPGTYIVDIQAGTVGSGANTLAYCLYLPSDTWLQGAGIGITLIQLKAVVRTPNVSGHVQFMVVNQHPDLTTDADIFVSDLTLDGNRQNQGPYSFNNISLAVAASNLVYLLGYWGGSRMGADRLEIINGSEFGVYLENNVSNLTFGQIRSRNCVAATGFDAAANGTFSQISVINSDAAYVVNTTSTSTVTGGSSQTFVVGSATGIAINGVLDLAMGTSVQETVLVTNVVGTSITAYCAHNHGPTSFAVNDARYPSDAAVQPGPLTLRLSFGLIDVDYSAALHVLSAAVEIFGAKEIAISSLVTRGTLFGVWLHNWFVSATLFVPRDITIGAITIVNPVVGASGILPIGIRIDDQGYVAYPSQTITDISIAAATVHYGAGGASIPNQAVGLNVTANVRGLSVGELVVDGAYFGIVLAGTTGASFGAVTLRNLANEGVALQSAASNNSFGSLVVDNTGLTNGAFGQAVVTDSTAVSNNIINGLNATQIPGGSYVIDLTGSTGTGNYFSGNLANAGTALWVRDNANVNYFDNLIGYHLGTPASSALGANVTSVTPQGTDKRGQLAIVMAGALAANTRIATITFAETYGATGPYVLLVNQTFGVGLVIVNFYRSAASTGVSFDIACDQALALGTYSVVYKVER